MTFPGFNRVSAASLVDRLAAINNNWDLADAAFTSLKTGAGTNPAVANPTMGTEWVNSDGDLRVYNGSSWIQPDTTETWGAWQTMTLQAPFIAGITPCQLRISNFKNVEVGGTVQISGAGFPATPDYVLINAGQFGAGYLPEMTTVIPIPGNIPGTGFTNGQAYLTVAGSPLTLQLYVLYQGVKAVGNSLRLDGIKYKAA